MSRATVGVLGGGQLARMLALAGAPLDLRFRFLDPQPEVPAAALGERVAGAYDDPAALDRFAAGADVVTYEFENVPVDSARRLAARVPLLPPPGALELAQDRFVEKTFFQRLGIATPPFAGVATRAELEGAVARIGLPAVLKTRRLGYDGKGQEVLQTPADVGPAWERMAGADCILEGFVRFARELSILAVRGRDGDTRFWPLVENEHRGSILRVSRAPAPKAEALRAAAEEVARRILEDLRYVGVLTVELFEVDGRLLANEMAPRVHNSGHWTIEGAETSQFENHLRALVGLPLGSTAMAAGHAAMVNLIGTLPDVGTVLAVPGAHLHLYGKTARAGRKLGHVTVRTADAAAREAALERLRALIG